MIRLSYRIDGQPIEEIIDPRNTPITTEMLENIHSIYDFDTRCHYTGREAYIKGLEIRNFVYMNPLFRS